MVAHKIPSGTCTICRHPDRGRIDYLLCTTTGSLEWGTGLRALGQKFGVSFQALGRHRRAHISAEYRRAVRIGPFQSEDHLRKLLAEEGASVLDRYNSVYSGHLSRWLVALEAGNDEQMLAHGRLLSMLLSKVGLLTREMLPPGAHTRIEQNFYLSPDFFAFQKRALGVLRRHPEAMNDWIAEFRPEPPLIEHAEAVAD
jgi:hypothetical protein